MNRNTAAVLRLPAVRLGTTFLAGCLAAYYAGEQALLFVLAGAVVLAGLCFALKKGRLLSVGLLCGMLCMSSYLWLYCRPLEEMSGSTVRAECLIVSSSRVSETYSYGRAACVIGGYPALVDISGGFEAGTGDRMELEMTLAPSASGDHAFSDGVVLVGDVTRVFRQERRPGLLYYAARARSGAVSRLSVLDGDAGALCRGLLLGDTSGFSLRLQRDITFSGVNYMTAVSGAHITLVMVVLMELFGRKRVRLHAYISLIVIPFLIAMFGFSPSVTRAGLMVLICKCAPLFQRQPQTMNSLCVAILAMTVFTPFAAADPAFLMSVLGVFGAAVLGPELNRLRRFSFERRRFLAKLKEAAVLSLSSMVCIAPVSVALFGGISLVEIPASVALAPLFTAAVTLGVLYLVSGLHLFAVPLDWVMELFRGVIGWFGGIDGVWLPGGGALEILLLFLTAALIILGTFSAEFQGAFGTSALTAALFVILCLNSRSTRKQIDLLSDGRSGAAAVISGNQAALVISGTGGGGFDKELFNEFLRCGVTHITAVNAPELDYSGAYSLSLLGELFPIDLLLCPETVQHTQARSFAGTELGDPAERFTVDGVEIACAKAGDVSISGDIVLYYGYKKSVPETSAGLALYVSAWQNEIPENGINVYDEPITINIKEIK